MSHDGSLKIKIEIPEIRPEDRTPVVDGLLRAIDGLVKIVQDQAARIDVLEREISKLKGQSPRPNIKPSTLEKEKPGTEKSEGGKRPGSAKSNKTSRLKIHEVKKIPAKNVPKGSRFKGYQDYVVQDVKLQVHNTQYRLERWQSPDGKEIVAPLPESIQGKHFGPVLNAYVVCLSAQMRVTQPLIHEHLLDLGIDISTGQIDRILSEWGNELDSERKEILRVGLEVAPYIQVDDTGSRHKGKNGVCTQIGGEFFTYFCSTESKSRINFLELLQGENRGYLLNEFSREYLQKLGIKSSLMLTLPWGKSFSTPQGWQSFLHSRGVSIREREITEAALLGHAVANGLRQDLLIISDDAGQFNVMLHALCWYHAERPLQKLIPLTEENRQDLEKVLGDFWQLYQDLKGYKKAPSAQAKGPLEQRFDTLSCQTTSFHSLNLALERLRAKKNELLMVLQHPEIPLHNNGSEGEIREYATRRKISAGTRSDNGRTGRDTLISLKKTLRKLGQSFWAFMLDRTSAQNQATTIAQMIRYRYSIAEI
jgi:hypothetical protein